MRSVYYRSIFLVLWLIATAAAAATLTVQPSSVQTAYPLVASR